MDHAYCLYASVCKVGSITSPSLPKWLRNPLIAWQPACPVLIKYVISTWSSAPGRCCLMTGSVPAPCLTPERTRPTSRPAPRTWSPDTRERGQHQASSCDHLSVTISANSIDFALKKLYSSYWFYCLWEWESSECWLRPGQSRREERAPYLAWSHEPGELCS